MHEAAHFDPGAFGAAHAEGRDFRNAGIEQQVRTVFAEFEGVVDDGLFSSGAPGHGILSEIAFATERRNGAGIDAKVLTREVQLKQSGISDWQSRKTIVSIRNEHRSGCAVSANKVAGFITCCVGALVFIDRTEHHVFSDVRENLVSGHNPGHRINGADDNYSGPDETALAATVKDVTAHPVGHVVNGASVVAHPLALNTPREQVGPVFCR